MALVTCPKCKKIVDNASNKCPNCGKVLSYSALDKNAPSYARMHLVSNVLLVVSCVLLLIEFMGGIKTYVGGIVFGAGFLLQGLALMEREKVEGYDGKKRGWIAVIIAIVFIAAGTVYLILDLR